MDDNTKHLHDKEKLRDEQLDVIRINHNLKESFG